MDKNYKPVACDFYDELVLLAMKKQPIIIIPNLFDIGEGDYIKDIVTKSSKEEYLILNYGQEIRLDRFSNLEDNILFLELDEADLEEE